MHEYGAALHSDDNGVRRLGLERLEHQFENCSSHLRESRGERF
jgi:hypothetical protein